MDGWSYSEEFMVHEQTVNSAE